MPVPYQLDFRICFSQCPWSRSVATPNYQVGTAPAAPVRRRWQRFDSILRSALSPPLRAMRLLRRRTGANISSLPLLTLGSGGGVYRRGPWGRELAECPPENRYCEEGEECLCAPLWRLELLRRWRYSSPAVRRRRPRTAGLAA